MRNQWNQRYCEADYYYGTEPNSFFKSFVDQHKPGKLLLTGEGEGRNAVYAAAKNFQVHAIDLSKVAKEKALKLALSKNLSICYQVKDLRMIEDIETYDYIVMIYNHFPPEFRTDILNRIQNALKPGGILVFEAFSKKQFFEKSGGPKNSDMLYSVEEIKKEFNQVSFICFEERREYLEEGKGHQGEAEIIRFTAKKYGKAN